MANDPVANLESRVDAANLIRVLYELRPCWICGVPRMCGHRERAADWAEVYAGPGELHPCFFQYLSREVEVAGAAAPQPRASEIQPLDQPYPEPPLPVIIPSAPQRQAQQPQPITAAPPAPTIAPVKQASAPVKRAAGGGRRRPPARQEERRITYLRAVGRI